MQILLDIQVAPGQQISSVLVQKLSCFKGPNRKDDAVMWAECECESYVKPKSRLVNLYSYGIAFR